ncbi:MAG: GGDEF domain-containing protein [Planctomycetales bacterium]|nr:GGDEF domain-containing protein [Planctomycetales bacterium]
MTEPDKSIPHAVLFIDLDEHGHAFGDRVLVALAARWQQCFRSEDLIARYGGDEFVVLLAEILNEQELQPIVARLTSTTSEPIIIDGVRLTVTAAIGVAMAGDTSVELNKPLAEADRDMYASKRKA